MTARRILHDAEFISAGAAEHSGLSPILPRPDLDRMIRKSLMALLAGVIDATAFHPNGNNVESGSVVSTACLSVEIDPANF